MTSPDSDQFRIPKVFTLAALLIALFNMPAAAQSASSRIPVLVELFTSEGCSDCPPADRLLAKLDKEQFAPGVDAIVLSEHVTYWNRLGWRDPFSLDLADARQYTYGRQFNLSSVYTPQAVVDGAWQFVGSDEQSLRAALNKAASTPKSALAIEGAEWKNGAAAFHLRGALNAGTHLYVALAADATHSEVARGENAGRTLQHVAVVRALKEFKASDADGHFLQLSAGSGAQAGSANGAMRLVVFATDAKTGRVVAAAESALH